MLLLTGASLAADPGLAYPSTSEASDQKAGSLLFYNAYTSSASAPDTANTRINITNTFSTRGVSVHLFFVDGTNCSVADSFICLTANQTASFLTSDVDPGVSGYIVAIATNTNGQPIKFDFLIGDEYVKYATGHSANLGAVAFAAQAGEAPAAVADDFIATLGFTGQPGGYNRAPRVLALDNIPSRADGNDTLLILNRLGGNLATGAATLGPIFGIVYDDAETAASFTFLANVCQFRSSLSNSFPRTTPRIEGFIPTGRSGWMKIFSQNDIAILGAMINLNTSNGFSGGHNLHHLTLTAAASITIPIFPSSCGGNDPN
jgi:hypothetical protein